MHLDTLYFSIVSSLVPSRVFKEQKKNVRFVDVKLFANVVRLFLSSAFRSSRVYHAFKISSLMSFSSDVSKTFGRMTLFSRISIARPSFYQVYDSSLQKCLHVLDVISDILSNFEH